MWFTLRLYHSHPFDGLRPACHPRIGAYHMYLSSSKNINSLLKKYPFTDEHLGDPRCLMLAIFVCHFLVGKPHGKLDRKSRGRLGRDSLKSCCSAPWLFCICSWAIPTGLWKHQMHVMGMDMDQHALSPRIGTVIMQRFVAVSEGEGKFTEWLTMESEV